MGLWRLLKNNWMLFVSLGVGLFLFSYKLNSIPSGVYVDEAVVGYDAWSIAKTYKDHYGQEMPLYFKFFNSYTPGLFVYLEAVGVKIFGLSTEAIRFPSVVSMLAIVVGIYWFVNKYKLLKLRESKWITAILLVITPWAVFNARLGYETTFALALLAGGMLLWEKPGWSVLLISLSTYAGHSERYLAPLVILVIYFVFYYKKQPRKRLWIPGVVAFVTQLPNMLMMLSPAFWIKSGSMTSLFFEQYLSYFSPINLFHLGDYDPQRSIPKLATFYSWMFFPWMVGMYQLYINKKIPIYRYIFWLMVVSPIPAALANTSFSTQRALPLLVPYFIIIGIGTDRILSKVKAWIRLPLMAGVVLMSLALLWRSYFVLFPVERERAWNYGYEQLTRYVEEHPDKRFVIDNSRSIADIIMLYWMKYPPERYQKENPGGDDYYGGKDFVKSGKFANVEVRRISWENDMDGSKVLVGDDLTISEDQAMEHNLKRIWDIRDGEGRIVLQAYEKNK